MYLAFPDLASKHYSLRSTENQGIHSLMCGGAANLPIISAFQDFLSRLNKINQNKGAKHALKQAEGNTICSMKHRHN